MQLNELQKFVKNFIVTVLSSLSVALFNIFIISHLSKVLEVSGFGKVSYLMSYGSYFLLFTSLGMDVVAIRTIASDKSRIKEIFGALVPLKVLFSIIVFTLMLLPMLFIDMFQSFGMVLVVFSSIVLTSPFNAQCVFEASKRNEFHAVPTILSQLLNYLLVINLISSPDDLIIVGFILFSINLFIIIFHNITILKIFGRWKPVFDRKLWAIFIKGGIVISLIQILVQMIHYLDIFMLKPLKGDEAVGLYTAAYKAMFMLILLMSILHKLMYPILFENFKKNLDEYKNYFAHYFKFMLFFGYGTAIIFIFLAVPYLNIFFDLKVYKESILCFQILMLTLFVITINSPLHSGLLSAHKEKTLLGIVLFQVFCNITGNLILIPKYGIIGSAIATVITECVGLPFYLFFFSKIMPIRQLKNFITASLSVIPMALFLHYVDIFFVFEAIIAAAIMIAMAILLRGYTLKELLNMKNTLFTVKR